jgi:hypothetical protein
VTCFRERAGRTWTPSVRGLGGPTTFAFDVSLRGKLDNASWLPVSCSPFPPFYAEMHTVRRFCFFLVIFLALEDLGVFPLLGSVGHPGPIRRDPSDRAVILALYRGFPRMVLWRDKTCGTRQCTPGVWIGIERRRREVYGVVTWEEKWGTASAPYFSEPT